jgi:hypothetical protein
MEKKTSKRQTTIVTLSDHNKQEIRNIQLQRQVMEEEFDEKKKGMKTIYHYFFLFSSSLALQVCKTHAGLLLVVFHVTMIEGR